MLLAGIDEAGRGPALGPMALAIVVATKEQEEKLVALGVRDSKELNAGERERLDAEIREIAEESVVSLVAPEELNRLMIRKSLNEIEAMRIGEMLNSISSRPEMLFVDSPDIIEANFSKRIEKYCGRKIVIKSEHFADKNYPLVAAASIIAKVARDAEIEKLRKEFGEIGSGYPHDSRTIAFIRKYIDEKKCLPPFARTSWETNKRELDSKFQTKLLDWKGAKKGTGRKKGPEKTG